MIDLIRVSNTGGMARLFHFLKDWACLITNGIIIINTNSNNFNLRETKMPKMKTKSSAKKRFKLTATGKVKMAQAGKRHGMCKRSNKFIRNARGTTMMHPSDAKKVITYYLHG